MIQSKVDFLLALARPAVLAQALARAAFHEPYGMFDEFHWGAEDGRGELLLEWGAGGSEVGRAVEVGVNAGVGWVGGDSGFMDPEGVVVWELHELPWWGCC